MSTSSVEVMKPLFSRNRQFRRRMGAFVFAAAGLAGPAAAHDSQLEAAVKQLEADVKAVAQSRQGGWVELPTGGWSTRQFIHELHRGKDNTVLVQIRIDYIGATDDGSTSEVQTTWLHCDAGTRRVVAVRGFDEQGRRTYSTDTPQAEVERIEQLYTGTEQLICSEQYRLLEVADGYQRLGELLALRKQARSKRIPDRPIPIH